MPIELEPTPEERQLPKAMVLPEPDRRAVTRLDQQRARKRAMLSGALAACLGALVLWLNLFNLGNVVGGLRDLIKNKGPSSGPATSWSTQYAIAEREAKKIDSGAALGWADVSAWPLDSNQKNLTYTHSLELIFIFRGSSDNKITITFNDSAPTSTLKIEQEKASSVEYSELLKKSISLALPTVKLNARDAWQITWQEALAHAQQRQISPYPIIGLHIQDLRTDHPYAVWHLTYWPVPDDPNDLWRRFGEALSLNYTSSFDVHAGTGEILAREFKGGQPAPTPSFVTP